MLFLVFEVLERFHFLHASNGYRRAGYNYGGLFFVRGSVCSSYFVDTGMGGGHLFRASARELFGAFPSRRSLFQKGCPVSLRICRGWVCGSAEVVAGELLSLLDG